jgi:predicted transposase YdaD
MEMTWADKMFAKCHDQGLEDGRKEGRTLGMELGRQEGGQEAARQILLRQLGIRFGNLPQATRQQVAACTDLDQLHHWTDQVLTAPDLAAMGLDTAR